MDNLITKYTIQLAEPACRVGSARFGALVDLLDDIGAVFPYLNAIDKKSRYDHENRVLILDEPGQLYALRPHEIRVAEVKDIQDAQQIVGELAGRLNRIWQERDSVTPDFSERRPPPVMTIFKLLPGTSCKQCGYTTCMAFAAALSRGAACLEDCPPLAQVEFAESKDKLLTIVPVNQR